MTGRGLPATALLGAGLHRHDPHHPFRPRLRREAAVEAGRHVRRARDEERHVMEMLESGETIAAWEANGAAHYHWVRAVSLLLGGPL